MSREYSPNPPLLRLEKIAGGKVLINVNQIVAAHTFHDYEDKAIGSTIELVTGSTVNVRKRIDDLWDML